MVGFGPCVGASSSPARCRAPSTGRRGSGRSCRGRSSGSGRRPGPCGRERSQVLVHVDVPAAELAARRQRRSGCAGSRRDWFGQLGPSTRRERRVGDPVPGGVHDRRARMVDLPVEVAVEPAAAGRRHASSSPSISSGARRSAPGRSAAASSEHGLEHRGAHVLRGRGVHRPDDRREVVLRPRWRAAVQQVHALDGAVGELVVGAGEADAPACCSSCSARRCVGLLPCGCALAER